MMDNDNDTYDPEDLLAAVKELKEGLRQLDNDFSRSLGLNGMYADGTPTPVMKYADEVQAALLQAQRAAQGVAYAVKRWERCQKTGEKF